MTIQPVLKMWVCVDGQGFPDATSIHWYKSQSIKNFLGGATKPWQWFRKKHGWDCVRVNIHFELITPATAPEKETTL